MGRRDRDPALCPVVARRAHAGRSLQAAVARAPGRRAPRLHHARPPEDRVRGHLASCVGAAQRDRTADRGGPGVAGGAKAPRAQRAAIGARGGERGRLELKALLLDGARRPLRTAEIPRPAPGPGQVLLAVRACGVCRTDLHVLDGEHSPSPNSHSCAATGWTARLPGSARAAAASHPGSASGYPGWAGRAASVATVVPGRENLCDRARFTGYQLDGGYAEYAVADERFCFALPDTYGDLESAPLVCAGIHMSDSPTFPYDLLWGERVLRSVATLTRRDGEEFLALAPRVPVRTTIEPYPWNGPTRRSSGCARGRSEERPCSRSRGKRATGWRAPGRCSSRLDFLELFLPHLHDLLRGVRRDFLIDVEFRPIGAAPMGDRVERRGVAVELGLGHERLDRDEPPVGLGAEDVPPARGKIAHHPALVLIGPRHSQLKDRLRHHGPTVSG